MGRNMCAAGGGGDGVTGITRVGGDGVTGITPVGGASNCHFLKLPTFAHFRA